MKTNSGRYFVFIVHDNEECEFLIGNPKGRTYFGVEVIGDSTEIAFLKTPAGRIPESECKTWLKGLQDRGFIVVVKPHKDNV